MIAVRIPEEIRKYKERIAFGLSGRQLIASIIALGICVPLYLFGRNFLNEDVLGYLVIGIGSVICSIGFVKVNGLPMEKFALVVLKIELLYPINRKYKSENAFSIWNNEAVKEELPKPGRASHNAKKRGNQVSLERAALMEEAEENGQKDFDVSKVKLRTVKPEKKSNKNIKNKKQKIKLTADEKLQSGAEAIEGKQKLDPHYLPDKKERGVLAKWYKKRESLRKRELIQKKKIEAKKNANMKKRRVAKTVIPRTTQNTIPYIADYEEGVFEVTPNKFSKVYRIQDINYRTGREEEQILIFNKYGEFLNYFSDDMRFQFCIDNRTVSIAEQERNTLYRLTGDNYDKHRAEYNRFLRRQIVAGRNDIQVQKFVTVTIESDTAIEALLRFHKIDADIVDNMRKIGADAEPLSTTERLSYYHDKFRRGHEGDFQIDYDFIKAQGVSSKDYIAPTFFRFERQHFQIDNDYYKVMFINNLPSSLSDEFLHDMSDNNFPVTTSLSIQPVAQDKGMRIVKRQLTGIETNKIDAEKRAIRAGYNPDTIQHSIKDAHKQAEILYDDMLNKNQKMFFVTFMIMAHGGTLDELEENCKYLDGKARKYTIQLQTLTMQQEEGFKVALPFGYPPSDISVERTLTTESTAIFMPFSNQELFHRNGFYYGLNQISHNLVTVNRNAMKTPSGFVLGTSGSGKSFATKREILNVLLADADTGVLVVDPENEYSDFCRAFGGSVLKISPDSNNYINPMDMAEDYGLDEDDGADTPMEAKKEKAIKKKSDYIMSIIERMISVGNSADSTAITPQQKTLVDRSVRNCYRKYLDSDFNPGFLPTLIDLQDELDKERGTMEGRMVAEGVEYYTRGSMDIFAHKTNVEFDNRLVVFNVRDLGEQLRQIALIIVFDFIWNRMIDNKSRGVRTYCYCDEIHVMFQSYYSAYFLKQLYKRGRKYGLCITGVTQNVEDLLQSEQAKGMIANSDFIMMLNQSHEDLKILSGMLNISDVLKGYVIGADAGSGLLFAEKVIVPFVDRFPVESYLYKLMSTKFGEEMTRNEIDAMIQGLMVEAEEGADADKAGENGYEETEAAV